MGLFARLQKLPETRPSRDPSLPPELVLSIVRLSAFSALLDARSWDLAQYARVSRLAQPDITRMLYSVIQLQSRKSTCSLLSSLQRKGGTFAEENVRGLRIDVTFAKSARDDTVQKLHTILDMCSSAFIHAPSTLIDHLSYRSLQHPMGQAKRSWQPRHHDLAVNWSIASVFTGIENRTSRALYDQMSWPLPIRRIHLAMGESIIVNKQLLRLHCLLAPGQPLSSVTHLAIDCTHPALMYPQFLVEPIRRLLELHGLRRIVLRIAGPACLDADLRKALAALHDPRLALDVVGGVASPGDEMEQITLAKTSIQSWRVQALGHGDLWMAGQVMSENE